MFEGKTIRCAINPETGQESIFPNASQGSPKKVWVAGAGPAGLTAAYEAARLGHTVTIFEKDDAPGGQIRYASIPPFKDVYRKWIQWLECQVRGRGVEIRLGTPLTKEILTAQRPDAVIVATGGHRIIPAIVGIDLPHVCDAWQILAGSVSPGRNVLVIGGGLIGMEASDFLCEKVESLFVVEALPTSPVSKLSSHGYMLHRRLRQAGCAMIFGCTVLEIGQASVRVATGDEQRDISPVDQVVIAVGLAPRQELKGILDELGIPGILAGDAVMPRRIIEATQEGAQAAWSL
jgi:NADPH-dependent 2,4-dienoyl-CoA reductase/sulfur reductase-like enzyme